MSESSSETNGDSSFEFLNENNGAKPQNLSAVHDIPQMSTTVSTDTSKQLPNSLINQLSSQVIDDIPLNDANVEPKSRSDSSTSGFLDWIANNDFISKVAEKAKNSMDTVITTLDPGMKQIIYSGGDVNIMVTSDKDSKVFPIRDAFQQVFGRATISGMATQSTNIAAQPVGFEYGLKAAEERIKTLRMNTNNIPQNQVIVSLENFIVATTSDNWHDFGCLVLDDPVLGINLHIYTQSTPIPSECVNQMHFETPIDYSLRNSGHSITVGHVMSQKLNIAHDQWHSGWVGISRTEIIFQAANALANLYKNRLGR